MKGRRKLKPLPSILPTSGHSHPFLGMKQRADERWKKKTENNHHTTQPAGKMSLQPPRWRFFSGVLHDSRLSADVKVLWCVCMMRRVSSSSSCFVHVDQVFTKALLVYQAALRTFCEMSAMSCASWVKIQRRARIMWFWQRYKYKNVFKNCTIVVFYSREMANRANVTLAMNTHTQTVIQFVMKEWDFLEFVLISWNFVSLLCLHMNDNSNKYMMNIAFTWMLPKQR